VIVVDTSALVAIALEETEKEAFSRTIAAESAIVGAPTLLEARLVLSNRIGEPDAFLERMLRSGGLHVVAFDFAMYRSAASAFDRFGRGRGHPAKLNFGDCLAYAVAKTHSVPLLYKGTDFNLTDIRTALA
jgi:ribonuclease VapC